jgi:hypothetical protein
VFGSIVPSVIVTETQKPAKFRVKKGDRNKLFLEVDDCERKVDFVLTNRIPDDSDAVSLGANKLKW